MIAARRLGVAVAVDGGSACTRNVRGDNAGTPYTPRAGRLNRLFRPLIFSLSLTVLTNLVQTVEVDFRIQTVMADVPGAVVALFLFLPAGQQAKDVQRLERPVGGGPWPLQTTAYINDPRVG